MPYELRVVDQADEARRALLHERLTTYNVGVCPGMRDYERPGCLDAYLLDAQGEVLGGLVGVVRWRWYYVEDLCLQEDLRGHGHGRRLLLAAEAEARRRGCTGVNLGTMSFQARPFYEELGYRVIGEARDRPPGVSFYWLVKDLEEGPCGKDELGAPAPLSMLVTDVPDPQRQRRVGELLVAYNSQHNEALRRCYETGQWETALDVYLLDDEGRLCGGLAASLRYGWLMVRELWLEAGLRGRGWGRRLVEQAEEEARRRGCRQAQARIHSFQAPGFWRRLGYRPNGEIADFPPGHSFAWTVRGL